MSAVCLAAALAIVAPATAGAASITNKDEQAHTLIVTARGERSELVLGPGETVMICNDGCFLTLPNGDRAALVGPEAVEIVGGAAVIN